MGNQQNPQIGMQNFQQAHPIQTFLQSPEGQQFLMQFGQSANAASMNPNVSFGQGMIGSIGQGMQGYQQQIEQLKRQQQEDELMGMRRGAEKRAEKSAGIQEERFEHEKSTWNAPEKEKDFDLPMFREDVEIKVPYSRFDEFTSQGWVPGEIPKEKNLTALRIAVAKAGVDPDKPVEDWSQEELAAVWTLVGKMPSLFQMLLGGGMSSGGGGTEIPEEVRAIKDKFGVD